MTFADGQTVSVLLAPETAGRHWGELFEAQRAAIERELGAPFALVGQAGVGPLWSIRLAEDAAGPTLRLDRQRRTLVCEGRTLDEVEETFSYLRGLGRRPDGDWVIRESADLAEAMNRIETEVGTSYPAFALRGLDWADICARHRRLVAEAADPPAALQAWLAELEDAHTWVRPMPAYGELRYGLWTDGKTALFHDVPEASVGYQLGVRAGFRVVGEDLAGWWRRTGSTPQAKPYIVGRRLLAAPVGSERRLTAEAPDGRIISWSELVTPMNWDPVVTWRRLDSGDGYLRIRAFLDDGTFDAQVDEALAALRGCPELIVDLRGNPGGKLVLAHAFRDRFLRAEGVMGWIQPTLPDGGLAAKTPLFGAPSPSLVRWDGRLRILIDELTYSAGEDAVLGLQGLPHVLVVGRPSGGGSGRLRLVRLLPGWRLTISTALTFDRAGRCIEGAGIPVDVAL